ncbi:HAD-IA family hydrolase [Bacillus sp. FJAT-49711]|uniref:HAD-IA family hydrolase n=1 Tax=Bacillus sp. FJAT-49711 TaxID=2833585 RepID=UPI001BC8D657|nr:HAD-IA family hydrolase [Bacillus sp. FJAT-49711]MBS4220019.1 HAD-IA family hydrolase [Bacillus sp. FJAT-49711]
MNILWDFDGTLFDTYPVFAKILKQVTNKDISEDDLYAQLKISFSHAIRYFKIPNSQIKTFISHVNQLPTEDFKPFKGVEEILKYANKNVIMTHSTRKEVLKILQYYDWEKYFAEIVTGDSGFPRKPNPTSYKYLHKKHSIDLVIGDRSLDIIPAKEIGIKTCLFQNGELGSDYYLEAYEDFFSIIKVKSK